MSADFSVLSRRTLLKYGLSLAAFVLMGGTGALLALRGRAPSVEGLRCLTDHEYRTLDGLADALFPQGGAFPLGARDVDLARAVDVFLADAREWDQHDLKRGLVLLEFGPVLFERRAVTFSNLSEDERRGHFERWTTAGDTLRRQVAGAFRSLLALHFYDRPEAWTHVGYEGPLVNVRT